MSSDVPTLRLTKALTIAASDSGGGAGIQADLKTFAAFGVYGLTCLTGVTAQNTVGVQMVELLSPAVVEAQLDSVLSDIGADAVKIGLLGSPAITDAAIGRLSRLSPRPPIILDPVMVSQTGHPFLDPASIEALKALMPLATLATPNLYEAGLLSGMEVEEDDEESALAAAAAIAALGAEYVLVKGGHGRGPEARDLLFGGEDGPKWLCAARVMTKNTHGTGCTLSSAVAAALARGEELGEAVALAKHYVTGGIASSIDLGEGPGPLNHFHHFYNLKSGGDRHDG